ncbi:MAG: 30S ribosome-binding factor RbfA [Candidatus Doudnabacteria bacterium]|nr:30S ribosome-binding factor RbfA [Candidatus Doudnabacteria bacterium]
MTRRTEKVAATLQEQLGFQMQKIELPFLTTISKVEVTQDLKHAKVWITIFSDREQDEQAVLAALEENKYDLQGEMYEYFASKNVPRIHFAVDHSEQYSDHINKLLRETKE